MAAASTPVSPPGAVRHADGPALLFVHGWGFDVGAWQSVTELLAHRRIILIDLGFGGRPCLDLPAGPVVAIGHSLGLMWLLRHAAGADWRGLASVAGFPRFTRAPDWPGVDPRPLRLMRRRLDAEPLATRADFLQLCGLAAGEHALADADLGRLGEGLDWLRDWDERIALAAFDRPILALAAEDDAVVPAGLTEAAFARHPQARIILRPDGGHALPLTRPDWCAARIDAFLSALDADCR